MPIYASDVNELQELQVNNQNLKIHVFNSHAGGEGYCLRWRIVSDLLITKKSAVDSVRQIPKKTDFTPYCLHIDHPPARELNIFKQDIGSLGSIEVLHSKFCQNSTEVHYLK